MIQFNVPGNPVPKGRARSFVRNGRVGHYTPAKTANYEKAVSLLASIAMGERKPVKGVVNLKVFATMPIPSSWSKKRQKEAFHHFSRPDLDNIVKAICDGCNGVVWDDDSQIGYLTAEKRYGEEPGVHVVVDWLNKE